MTNYTGRSINYTPRMTDAEAYEHLSPNVRRALQEAVTSWSSYASLRLVRKHGDDAVVKMIRNGDVEFCRKGFVPGRGKRKPVPSSLVECGVPILRSNW